jgi:alkanesulfonate monooxygenase
LSAGPVAPNILWYIGAVDGEIPWDPRHATSASLDDLRLQARNLDQLGYFGALTTAREPISMVGDTEQLRFVVPEYPGVKPPALLAEQAQVFDNYSGGRLIFNQVNGADPVLARYGRFEAKDERYELSKEYWRQVKSLYLDDVDAHDGEFVKYGPRYKPPIAGERQRDGVPVWGTGASPAGIDHATAVLDVYLSFLGPIEVTADLFDRVRKAAATVDKKLKFGVLTSVIVRETEQEAWDHFEWQLANTAAQAVLATADRNLRSFGFPALDELTSPDAKVQNRIDALRAGRLPAREDLEFAPNMAAGLTTWTGAEPPFDIAGKGTGTYLVGSAENVASRMREMAEIAGIDYWLLSGWPLVSEARITAELLFPQLGFEPRPAGSGRTLTGGRG